jgi:hypothetical protein
VLDRFSLRRLVSQPPKNPPTMSTWLESYRQLLHRSPRRARERFSDSTPEGSRSPLHSPPHSPPNEAIESPVTPLRVSIARSTSSHFSISLSRRVRKPRTLRSTAKSYKTYYTRMTGKALLIKVEPCVSHLRRSISPPLRSMISNASMISHILQTRSTRTHRFHHTISCSQEVWARSGGGTIEVD